MRVKSDNTHPLTHTPFTVHFGPVLCDRVLWPTFITANDSRTRRQQPYGSTRDSTPFIFNFYNMHIFGSFTKTRSAKRLWHADGKLYLFFSCLCYLSFVAYSGLAACVSTSWRGITQRNEVLFYVHICCTTIIEKHSVGVAAPHCLLCGCVLPLNGGSNENRIDRKCVQRQRASNISPNEGEK